MIELVLGIVIELVLGIVIELVLGIVMVLGLGLGLGLGFGFGFGLRGGRRLGLWLRCSGRVRCWLGFPRLLVCLGSRVGGREQHPLVVLAP